MLSPSAYRKACNFPFQRQLAIHNWEISSLQFIKSPNLKKRQGKHATTISNAKRKEVFAQTKCAIWSYVIHKTSTWMAIIVDNPNFQKCRSMDQSMITKIYSTGITTVHFLVLSLRSFLKAKGNLCKLNVKEYQALPTRMGTQPSWGSPHAPHIASKHANLIKLKSSLFLVRLESMHKTVKNSIKKLLLHA